MASKTQTLEIESSGAFLRTRMTQGATGDVGQWEYYRLCSITSITGNPEAGFAALLPTNQKRNPYAYEDMLKVVIEFDGTHQPDLVFDVQDVSNQAGWTADETGLAQALTDIKGWVDACCCASGGGGGGEATETTQLLVLSEVQDINTNTSPGTTGVVTPFAFGALAASATLQAANTSRKRVVVTNDTDAILYVKEGATAAVGTDYTWKVGIDESAVIEDYTGVIDGILAGGASSGNVLVTEIT